MARPAAPLTALLCLLVALVVLLPDACLAKPLATVLRRRALQQQQQQQLQRRDWHPPPRARPPRPGGNGTDPDPDAAPEDDGNQPCEPWTVPEAERCAYVVAHAASCFETTLLINYLEIFYCQLSSRALLFVPLAVAWLAFLFAIMLAAAQRFFCPALEVISEYLQLSPTVAGATLLAFGNGAPDVFTQLAAMALGDTTSLDSDGITMALSEPLGGGMFVSSVVLAGVIMASQQHAIRVNPGPVMKDLAFYACAVAFVYACLLHGNVHLWGCAVMTTMYVAYVAVTILLSKAAQDEPVHADPLLHEVPLSVHDFTDSESGWESANESDYQSCDEEEGGVVAKGHRNGTAHLHRLAASAPLDTAPPHRLPQHGHSLPHSLPQAVGHGLCQPLLAGAGGRGHRHSGSSTSRGLWPWSGSSPSVGQDEHVRAGGMAIVSGSHASSYQTTPYASPLADSTMMQEAAPVMTTGGGVAMLGPAAVEAAAPAQLASVASFTFPTAAAADSAVDGGGEEHQDRQQGQQQQQLQREDCAAAANGGAAEKQPVKACHAGGMGAAGPAEKDESVALLLLKRNNAGAHVDNTDVVSKPGSWGGVSDIHVRHPSVFAKVVHRPLIAILSTTMPTVRNHGHIRYPKAYAVLLPFTGTSVVLLWLGLFPLSVAEWAQVWPMLGLPAAASFLVACVYPTNGHLRGKLLGVCTVAAFLVSMLWLDMIANELVNVASSFGLIFDVKPSLLGATLLAWGNSVPDFTNNWSLTRDGFPTMALTACIASPLFVLLGGLVCTLTYGARHGTLALPWDVPLMVLYTFSLGNLIMWLVLVPTVFKFKLGRGAAVYACVVYGLFQVVYIFSIIKY